MKFVEVEKFPQTRNVIFKKLFLIMTSSCRHELFYDTLFRVAINRAKFHARTCSSFEEIRTNRKNNVSK